MGIYRSAEHLVTETFTVKAELNPGGEKSDLNMKMQKQSITTSGKTSYIYPWGNNNKLPNEMIELLRSNSDMGNLLDTRADFLYGNGIGLFSKKLDDAKNELVMTPFWTPKVYDALLEMEIEELVETSILNIVQLNNAFINISKSAKDKELSKFKALDSTTVRAEFVTNGKSRVEKYILSSKWAASDGNKYAKAAPAFYYDQRDESESIIHLKPKQPGQFYYGYAIWWGLATWIKVGNKIPEFYENALDSDGNLGNIIHIAKKYFDDVIGEGHINQITGKAFTFDEVVDAFDKTMDDMLFGSKGKRMNIRDICAYDSNSAKLVNLLEIEPIKKQTTGEEYKKTYDSVVGALSNGGKMLNGLSGMSDGKMNSSGGTEIRISAEYQQFYRTPRERRLILEFLNRVVLKELKKMVSIPEDVYFDFKNILLETLDQNKKGSSEQNSQQV